MLYDCMKWLVAKLKGKISLGGFVLGFFGVVFVCLFVCCDCVLWFLLLFGWVFCGLGFGVFF